MNHLSGSASPYLRQHAGNPVEWYPWGEAAFELARVEGKPLFVSIGYAACHWCHVMAHESFEDQATAEDLSRWFVSIKVDREERPDVDAAYMAAVQAMTGSGGWPMSVFCTPDGRPFFGGTYFPPTERHGLPSFRRVLSAVASGWADRRDEIDRQADALRETLKTRLGSLEPGTRVEWDGCLASSVEKLASRYDERWGGFGPAPKFPHPTMVELCLRQFLRHGDPRALVMATKTLDAMAAGGIYDHLAGGFARYSTDRFWTVPHFEKMLTDQALLARVYLHAWQVTKNSAYFQVASETIDFVASELWQDGFCASLDADAGGVEGSHATWTPDEVTGVLGPDRARDACAWFSITQAGDFEGRSVPHRPLGAPLGRPREIESARLELLEARRRRPQPARDDKILTEWNAMFLAVLAEAATVTANGGWAELATRGTALLFEENRRADGRWLRASSGDVPAFAADYAWLVECCCRMAELTGRAMWVERAQGIADEMLGLFACDSGTLGTVGHDAEQLYLQPPDVIDGAIPSASSIGAQSLVRAGALSGNARLTDAAARIVDAQAGLLSSDPLAVSDLLPALAMLDDGAEVVVVGDRPDFREALRRHWLPDAVVAWGEPTPSPLWEGRVPGAAYVCRKYACLEPARDVSSFEEQLLRISSGGRL